MIISTVDCVTGLCERPVGEFRCILSRLAVALATLVGVSDLQFKLEIALGDRWASLRFEVICWFVYENLFCDPLLFCVFERLLMARGEMAFFFEAF